MTEEEPFLSGAKLLISLLVKDDENACSKRRELSLSRVSAAARALAPAAAETREWNPPLTEARGHAALVIQQTTSKLQCAENRSPIYQAPGRKKKEGFHLKVQESAENYLETILILKQRLGQVRSIDIVNELNFSKPSVSVAMKKLRENGMIEMDSDGMISLLPEGYRIASTIYERHILLSEYLTSLGVDPKIAVEDACRIEHVISEESFNKIKEHASTMHDKLKNSTDGEQQKS